MHGLLESKKGNNLCQLKQLCRKKKPEEKTQHALLKDLERLMKSSEAGEQNNPALKSCGGHTPKTKRKHIAITVSYQIRDENQTATA
jgi:hypothetical protein